MELLPQFAAVLAVFALLGLTLWWLKKRGAVHGSASLPFRLPSRRGVRQGKVLEHLDTLSLSPTHSLNVVRMADRAILIGTSPTGFYVVESHSWKSLQGQMDASASREKQT